jgi:hypothetical protein
VDPRELLGFLRRAGLKGWALATGLCNRLAARIVDARL